MNLSEKRILIMRLEQVMKAMDEDTLYAWYLLSFCSRNNDSYIQGKVRKIFSGLITGRGGKHGQKNIFEFSAEKA